MLWRRPTLSECSANMSHRFEVMEVRFGPSTVELESKPPLKERGQTLPAPQIFFAKKNVSTLLQAPMEFSHELFFKPQVLIENCRFRVFLMIFELMVPYWHALQVGDLALKNLKMRNL